ncbi:MAG: NADH-quinone oxidoreductase subunit J [Gammaproteobacteria bacterium]|nr:NADH-quinone oxidoreductase subunit J [Gammaproteobacteria bacterium]
MGGAAGSGIEAAVFFLFAGLLLGAALMVITLRNPVYAALCLVLAFFSSSALWLLLYAEFLAILLILIYVGAVMVLFLFVVMMLDINLAPLREGFARYLPIGGAVAVAMAGCMIWLLHKALETAAPVGEQTAPYGVKALGRLLFTEYLYPFELAGALLLVAIVAAIAMTQRGQRARKIQDPAAQVQVQPRERVRLVDMEADS